VLNRALITGGMTFIPSLLAVHVLIVFSQLLAICVGYGGSTYRICDNASTLVEGIVCAVQNIGNADYIGSQGRHNI